jgi:hypothetical protein
MSEAYTKQIGGTHYVSMRMQPFHFAMVNQWDSTSFSILKYVGRHRTPTGKGLIDLQKARHIVEIRLTEIQHALPGLHRISMGEYARVNNLDMADSWTLMTLESWVERRVSEVPLLAAIDRLIAEYGPATGA